MTAVPPTAAPNEPRSTDAAPVPRGEAAPVAATPGFLESWLDRAPHGTHSNVELLTERQSQRTAAFAALCTVVEDHLVGADVLTRMKFPQAAATFDGRIPRGLRIRSGDLAEIIATEYVLAHTEFAVPLKRLRYKDDREMSMRGDDIIGLHKAGGAPTVLKGEVKSRAALASAVVDEACASLAHYRGRPKPQTLSFIAMRLRDTDRDDEAEVIERLQGTRLGAGDIAHLVFTLSENDPASALTAHADVRRLINDRRLVGLRVDDHQQFIATVFEAVRAGRLAAASRGGSTVTVPSQAPAASKPLNDAAVD